MTAISVKESTRAYAASRQKEFSGHDRSNTVGASEIGRCERQTWFAKNDIPDDEGFVQRYGALERGNLIEQHWVVPALRESIGNMPVGTALMYEGEDQRTLVDGYLSATSDALFVGVNRDSLNWIGIPDIGPSKALGLEIKSVDPRVDIKKAKSEHEYQVQVQMGLLRACTNDAPDYTLIAYVDASFLDDVTEFAVRYDPAIYAAAQTRARRIMTAVGPAALHPEGKMAGGNECRYCAWASHCADTTVGSIPADVEPTLSENEISLLRDLAELERGLDIDIVALEEVQAKTRQDIKDFLREHKIRRYHGEDFSVAWSSAKPRSTLDQEAARAAGIDLSPYEKLGNASDRLTIKVK